MATAKLIVTCQLALKMTHREFGALVGKSERTLQRWADRGGVLLPSEADVLAAALDPVRPDLAAEVRADGRATGESLGLLAPSAALQAIVQAAATALGANTDAVRPALLAAFEAAQDAGVSVDAVVAGLERTG